jgi:hypothetical protein
MICNIRTARKIHCSITKSKLVARRKKSPVVAIDDKDKALRVLIVVAPQRADLVLATHIPNSETDVLVPENRGHKLEKKTEDAKTLPPSPSARALTPQSQH